MKILNMVSNILFVAAITAAIVGGCSGSSKEHAEKSSENKAADTTSISVVVSEIALSNFEDWGSYSAELRGSEDAYLNAPAQGGRVKSIKAVGSYVKSGDALCDIEGDIYEAALLTAQAQLDVAKGDYERTKVNVEKGSIGRSALDGANLAYQNAKMNVVTAKRAYDASRCEAPFDGVIVSRSVERFNSVGPGTPTLRLSKLSQLEALIAIPESEVFGLSEGMKAEFRLLQESDRFHIGKITSIDRAVDSHTRTVSARILVDNKEGLLKPGMVGRARILKKNYSSAIIIPAASILHLQTGPAVMVVVNGAAQQRTIEIETTNGENVLIKTGLNAGDKLIVAGGFQVSNGTRVKY
jgi:membrane fusion protein (multidrug efflux system)